MTDRKPVADMDEGELRAALTALPAEELVFMLVYLAGWSPRGMDSALDLNDAVNGPQAIAPEPEASNA